MLKITVADDETPIRKWICSIIRRLPDLYTLAGVASNGKEALEYIRTEHPDIALLDIKMPVMDGLQVLNALLSEKAGTVPVMLSNYDDFQYVHGSFTEGAFDYLLKSELTEEKLTGLYDKVMAEKNSRRISILHSMSGSDFIISLLSDKTLDKQELAGCLSRSDVSLDDSTMACMVLLPQNDEEKNKILSADIQNYLYDGISNFHFFVLPGPERLFLLFNLSSSSTLRSFQLHNSYAQYLFQRFGVDIGTCSPVSGFSGLQSAVRGSNIILQSHFFSQSDSRHIYYNYPLSEKTLQQKRNELLCIHTELEKAVNSADYPSAAEKLKHFLKHAEELRSQDAEFTDMLLFSILYCFDNSLDDAQDVSRNSLGNDAHALFRAPSFSNIRETLCSALERRISQEKRFSPAVKSITEYIDRHYAEISSMQDIAECYRYNTDYLYRLFKKETGISFIAYLTKTRIQHAAELLATTETDIPDIADSVGYKDTAYFIKLFKKVYRFTPGQYRKNFKSPSGTGQPASIKASNSGDLS